MPPDKRYYRCSVDPRLYVDLVVRQDRRILVDRARSAHGCPAHAAAAGIVRT
jgi:hypothetical protein